MEEYFEQDPDFKIELQAPRPTPDDRSLQGTTYDERRYAHEGHTRFAASELC